MTKTQWQKFVVIQDLHFPFHDENCFELVKRYLRQTKPSEVILNGDIFDNATCSTWPKSRHARFHKLVDEIRASQGLFDSLLEACGKAKVVFVDGNHEFRFDRYLMAMAPVLEDMDGLEFEHLYKFKERGIEYHKAKANSGLYHLTPKLAICHGDVTGQEGNSVAKRMWTKLQHSAVIGHAHKEGQFRIKGLDREDVVLAAGCLCQPMDYMFIDNWQRGFVDGMVNRKTGEFQIDHVRISGENFNTLYSREGSIVLPKKK